jgi:hypothetical protein
MEYKDHKCTDEKPIAKTNIGLAICLSHNIGRHFCFGAFCGNFYVMHTTQPVESTFGDEDEVARMDREYLHQGIMTIGEGWRHVHNHELISEHFCTVGWMPITCEANMKWKKNATMGKRGLQKWHVHFQ